MKSERLLLTVEPVEVVGFRADVAARRPEDPGVSTHEVHRGSRVQLAPWREGGEQQAEL